MRGVFILSLDTELAWGALHNRGHIARQHLYEQTRPAIKRLLALHEEFGIEATWAIVGSLFETGYPETGGMKHPELVRPTYGWLKDDWLEPVPAGDSKTAPNWYAPDIVESVLECSAPQEVGCHTFTHVIVGEPGCSRACFDSELAACQAAASKWGVELKTLVFPRNSIGHLDVLASHGFQAFRGNVSAPWQRFFPGPVGKAARGMQWTLPVPPLTAAPKRVGSLWDLPATTLYLHRGGVAGRIPIELRVRRARSGIRQAIRRGETFHLYFHPFNLATDPDGMLDGLRRIYQTVATERDQGRLLNLTMKGLADSLGPASTASGSKPT
ncbi:MAG: hypothetical protein ACR2QM_10105 [Longimicrobiales bacterium]